MQTTTRDVAEMFKAIDELDFTKVKAKLMHRSGDAAALPRIEHAEAAYRQFLKLVAKYPGAPIVPSEEIDEFWHMHILDTQRYGADCERIFGYMIHHDPYSGIDGAEDEARHLAIAAASNALAVREFGAAAYCVVSAAKKDAAAYCVVSAAKEDAAAYCVVSAAQKDAAAYCVVSAAKGDATAYCVKPEAKGSAGYCVRVAGPVRAGGIAQSPLRRA